MKIVIRSLFVALAATALAQGGHGSAQPQASQQPAQGSRSDAPDVQSGMMGPHGPMAQDMPHDPAMMANCQAMHAEMAALRAEMASLRAELQKGSRSR